MRFFQYRYDLLQPFTYWPDGNCNLASLDDLAAMKLVAIAQRGSRKDFIDMYVLIQQYKPLNELLSTYQKKYRTDNIAPVLMGLSYFDDAEHEPDPALWNVEWREVKELISSRVRGI